MGAAEAQELVAALRHELGIQLDFTQILLAFALLMARVLPVVILTPFLGEARERPCLDGIGLGADALVD